MNDTNLQIELDPRHWLHRLDSGPTASWPWQTVFVVAVFALLASWVLTGGARGPGLAMVLGSTGSMISLLCHAAVALIIVTAWWRYRTAGLALLAIGTVVLPLVNFGLSYVYGPWIHDLVSQGGSAADAAALSSLRTYLFSSLISGTQLLALVYISRDVHQGQYRRPGIPADRHRPANPHMPPLLKTVGELPWWPHRLMALVALMAVAAAGYLLTGAQAPITAPLFASATVLRILLVAFVIVLWWHYRTRGLGLLSFYLVVPGLVRRTTAPFLQDWVESTLLAGGRSVGESVATTYYAVGFVTHGIPSVILFLGVVYLVLEIRGGVYREGGPGDQTEQAGVNATGQA